jgi:hypothetical protein
MSYWNELNKYEVPVANYGLIPNGTIVKVRMTIKPGGYNDPEQGWADGYATKSEKGTIALDVEFVVLEGQYTKRKVWGKIGLCGNNGPDWSNMGKAFIKSILNSAKGISPKDNSEAAMLARKIDSFKPLDGIEFIARIDVTKDQEGNDKNEIRAAITPDHKDYDEAMGKVSISTNNHTNANRPNWASGGDRVKLV